MLASRHQSLTSVRRDAWVEVDLSAIESNVRVVLSWLSPGTELMAVAKSDGYGHGAAAIAPVLLAAGATRMGVASVDEGLQLRQAGLKCPILILSPSPFWAMSAALEAGLELTVTSASQVRDLASVAARMAKPARLHLKVDSGMHRLGASPAEVPAVLDEIAAAPALTLAGVFSHLARADEAATTEAQNARFRRVLAALAERGCDPELIHLASGEAARRFPDSHYDMVRVGLYLYGLEPAAVSQAVTAALSLRARINHISTVDSGESAGYNHTWTAERDSRLASIPIGYGDGVDRGLSNRITGLLLGREIRQVGLISMDQMLFDVTDVPAAQEGDIITLIGSETGSSASAPGGLPTLHLATWAAMLDTITYELACRLRVRLPRIYTRQKRRPAPGPAQ